MRYVGNTEGYVLLKEMVHTVTAVFKCSLSKDVEQSSSVEANISATEETVRFLYTFLVHFKIYKNPILSQMNPSLNR
jgi:hypothetical protein